MDVVGHPRKSAYYCWMFTREMSGIPLSGGTYMGKCSIHECARSMGAMQHMRVDRSFGSSG